MSKNLHLWLALFTVALAGSANFVLTSALDKGILQNGVIIGNDFYFWDSTTVTRNRASALAYCTANEGSLAKLLDYNRYNVIRIGMPVLGTYWIDGLDKANFEQFKLTNGTPYPTLTDIPLAQFFFTSRSCLNLKKGATSTDSGIYALDCATATHRVLCQMPLSKMLELYE